MKKRKLTLNEELSEIKRVMKKLLNEDDLSPMDRMYNSDDWVNAQRDSEGYKDDDDFNLDKGFNVGDIVLYLGGLGEIWPGEILKVYKNIDDAEQSGEKDVSFYREQFNNPDAEPSFGDEDLDKPLYKIYFKSEGESLLPGKSLTKTDKYTKEDVYKNDDENEDMDEYDDNDEPDICGSCNGSGEGMYDGSTCSTCRGKGVIFSRRDDPSDYHDSSDYYDDPGDTEAREWGGIDW